MTVSTDKVVSLIASKNLLGALKVAAGIAPKQFARLALSHLHLSFKGDDIVIEASDLDMYYRKTVFIPGLGITEPFSLMVHRDAVAVMKPSMEVTFSESFYTVGGIKYTPSSSPSEFPQFPELEDSKFEVTTAQGYFAELASCAVSASESELRPILRGVCHRGNTLAATDGSRLCSSDIGTQWPKEVVVPGWAAAVLEKVFGVSSSYMAYDDRYVQYRGNGYRIMIRTIEGAYPDVSRIMPSMFKTTVTVRGAEEWIAACERATTVHKQIPKKGGRDENYTTVLQFDTSGITLTVQKEQEFRAQLPGEFSGEPVTIACNAQYLRDALVQTGNGAEAHFNGEKQPFLLVSSSESMYQRKALVSPLKMK